MAGLLQTKGPVSTHTIVRSSWRFLRLLSSKQFLLAGQDLEVMGLGRVVHMQGKSSQAVFVKQQPNVAQVVLQANSDLCSSEYYATRFYEEVSKMLPQNLKQGLVTQGHVSPQLFQPSNPLPQSVDLPNTTYTHN